MTTTTVEPVLDAHGDPVPMAPGQEEQFADPTFRQWMAGRVPASRCSHYIAASEARAGATTCERCTDNEHLTNREVDVLRQLSRGLRNREIGAALGIGEETVKAHLKAVFRKLDVSNRTAAATWALAPGREWVCR